MGWGDSFKQKWNGATDAAKQKASALATGARQVGVKALEKTQATAAEAARKASEAAAWAQQTAAKAAQAAQQKAQQAAQAVQQKARQAAAVTAKKVKQTFVNVKKSFDEWKQTQAVAPCPKPEKVSQFLNFEAKQPTAPGQLKTGFDASAYQLKNSFRGADVEAAAGYGGVDADGFKVGAEAGVLKAKGTFYSGNNACNPFARADVEAKALSASAKGDFLAGYDTNRYGVSLGVDAAASYAGVEARPEVNIPIPFTGWSIAARGKLSADAGLSAGGGGHAYYDKREQRAHVGLFGKIIGGAGLDISIGKKYTGAERRADW